MSKQKTDLQVFQEWVQELTGFVFGTEEKPKPKKRKRARKKDVHLEVMINLHPM